MLSRRRFIASIGALGMPLLFGACNRSESPLRIARHLWPGYEFMFLAQREGWFAKQHIVLVETDSATKSIELLASGQIDGAALTLDEVLGARARGLPLTAVLIFDISLGADVLLGRPGIETMAQLKDKRIAYEPSAVGALMLYKALEKAGLRPNDVKTIPVTFDRHWQVWHGREIDALITFEPVSSQLEGEGASRLFDSADIPDTIFDVLALTPEALEYKSDALRHLIAGHFQGIRNFRKNPKDTAYRLADRFKLPAKTVISAYAGLELPGIIRNRKLLQGDNAPLVQTAKELSVFLYHVGIMHKPLHDYSSLASAEFLPREDIK